MKKPHTALSTLTRDYIEWKSNYKNCRDVVNVYGCCDVVRSAISGSNNMVEMKS